MVDARAHCVQSAEMAGSIRATGDWGGADPANVEAVARSAAEAFPVSTRRRSCSSPWLSDGDPPITLFDRSPLGEVVVRLNVRGNLWARLTYQFAHEYCHVLADIDTFTLDRFTWLEEALCETGSLFALRRMARAWATDAPYANWREYAPELARYAEDRMTDRDHLATAGHDVPALARRAAAEPRSRCRATAATTR